MHCKKCGKPNGLNWLGIVYPPYPKECRCESKAQMEEEEGKPKCRKHS